MSLDLLRAAQAVAAGTTEAGLPPDRLRFSLEYAAEPDVAAERARLAALLGGDNFALEPLDALLPRFLVLQFPGVERRMAPESLFAAADALVDELGLVSAVPDIGTSFVVAPVDPNRIENVADAVLNFTCWARENDGLPADWAVKAINAPAAWAKGLDGTGVLIAQPDTGVAAHVELDDALDVAKGFNVLTGTADPTDPVDARMGNPGHGTSTASAAASRATGKVKGVAPGAKIAPIRCINNVILGLDPSPVAKAILHAVRVEADVISLSLGGGQFSPAIAAALEKAAEAGIIVVAAAGNCVQALVVYPARDPNAIAIAGVNVADKPWKGTSRGGKVDVAAPAENVLVARRAPDDGGEQRVKPSQGTSYATAITAGLAAIWVQKHGRDTIRAHARRLGIPVNALFRTALKATARQPAGWPQGMGAGIPDAGKLVELDLARIQRAGAPESAQPLPDDRLIAALEESYDGIESGLGPWPRVGAESVFLLYDAWLRDNRAAAIPVESPARPRPSPGLRERMPESVRQGLAAAEPGPAMLHPTIGVPGRSSDFVRHLAAGAPSGAESSVTLTHEAARARILNPDGAARLIDRASRTLTEMDRQGIGEAAAKGEVMRRAEDVIRRAGEDRLDELDLGDRVALEALVRLNDRPAYRVTAEGGIATDDPLFGEWGGFLSLLVDLGEWTRSVGRIDLDGTHIGTGFLIAGDRVMTNRHVLEAVADEIAGPSGRRWQLRGRVAIDFSETADGSRSFELTGVLQAGPDPINSMENLAHLDMAVLALAPGGQGLPRALPLARQLDPSAVMLVIGYPARPGTSALVDPATGRVSQEIAMRLRAIFGTDYGRKYASPGHIIDGPGAIPTDVQKWAASHDCTTLGGNSGSVVVQFTGAPAVAGLHFSGAPLTANKAHVLGRVEAGPLGPIAGATWI